MQNIDGGPGRIEGGPDDDQGKIAAKVEAATPQSSPAPTPQEKLEPKVRLGRRPEPVRRSFAAVHRWAALVIGSLLLVQMACGVPLLWGAELFRADNSALYQHTDTGHTISASEAVASVRSAYPNFTIKNVIPDKGIYLVSDPDLNKVYGVDSSSGRITGSGHYYGGFQGLMENIHAFGLSSPSYPGYLPVMAKTIPSFGIQQLDGVTYGNALVGLLGLSLIFLALSGIYLWWPGIRRIAVGFRVRMSKANYVRYRELHQVVGIVSIPFLLIWGLTGAAAEFPSIQQALLTVTGGNPDSSQVKSLNWDFASDRAGSPTGKDIGIDAATSAALAAVPGVVHNTSLPDPSDPTSAYTFEISEPSWDPYKHTMLAGNGWVYVDAYNAKNVKIVWDGQGSSASNTLYEEVLYPSHFGWYVNGWWRIIWGVFGLMPLVLAMSGVTTWLIRAGKRRRRRMRQQQRASLTA
jgi:uncharacterized iron-regulated membrane protein